jgi:hypothetical protein
VTACSCSPSVLSEGRHAPECPGFLPWWYARPGQATRELEAWRSWRRLRREAFAAQLATRSPRRSPPSSTTL